MARESEGGPSGQSRGSVPREPGPRPVTLGRRRRGAAERSGEFPGWRAELRKERDAERRSGTGRRGAVRSGPGSPRPGGQGTSAVVHRLEQSRAGSASGQLSRLFQLPSLLSQRALLRPGTSYTDSPIVSVLILARRVQSLAQRHTAVFGPRVIFRHTAQVLDFYGPRKVC